MSQVRIGIVGCGQIARQHMATYAKIPDAKMVAFADIDEAAARDAAEKYGGDATSDFREVLRRDDVDAIDVCLHNNLHMPVTVAALEAGKDVYCEKPMAGSYRDAAVMLQRACETGRKLHIQLANLYSDETRAAKELIDAGELGDVYFAHAAGFRRRGRPYVDGYGTPNFVQRRNSAGGALYDMGVYHISQVLYLLGNPPAERISGKTYQRTDMDPARQARSGYDVEELAMALVRFPRDVSMELIESWAIHLDGFGGSYVVGSRGGVRLSPFGFFRSYGNLDVNGTADLSSARFRWDNVVGDGGLYANSQAHWIAALKGRVELLPTAEIALNTMLISQGVYLSQERGREVTAEEVREASVSTAVEV